MSETQQIEVTKADFIRLQKLAVPFVDTPATVISRLLDAVEAISPAGNSERASATPVYTPDNMPSLVHAKLMDASFDGRSPEKMNWDGLVRLALQTVLRTFGTIHDLRRITGANVVHGSKEDDGYKFVPVDGFSYQGVSAGDAARIIIRSARGLGCRASFEFAWRNKEGAFRPGERAIVHL